jgi:hypothetical protein
MAKYPLRDSSMLSLSFGFTILTSTASADASLSSFFSSLGGSVEVESPPSVELVAFFLAASASFLALSAFFFASLLASSSWDWISAAY